MDCYIQHRRWVQSAVSIGACCMGIRRLLFEQRYEIATLFPIDHLHAET